MRNLHERYVFAVEIGSGYIYFYGDGTADWEYTTNNNTLATKTEEYKWEPDPTDVRRVKLFVGGDSRLYSQIGAFGIQQLLIKVDELYCKTVIAGQLDNIIREAPSGTAETV